MLGYHSFLGGKRSKYDFSLNEMKRHIAYFKSRGFQFVSFQDIVKGDISGNKNILITIDDGNRSVYRLYRNVLKPAGIRPLLAVYTAPIGRERFALTWRQLMELSRDGCEIASHGYYHLKMSRRLYRKKRKNFLQEIYRPKSELEKHLGKQIRVFVFPYGHYIRSSFAHLNEAGYWYAFNTLDGAVFTELGQNKNRFELARYMIDRGHWKQSFRKIVRKSGATVSLARDKNRRYIPWVNKKEKKILARTHVVKHYQKEKGNSPAREKKPRVTRAARVVVKKTVLPFDKALARDPVNHETKKSKSKRPFDVAIGWSSFLDPKQKNKKNTAREHNSGRTRVNNKGKRIPIDGYSRQRIKSDYISREIKQRLKQLEKVKNAKKKGNTAMRRSLQNYNELLDAVWKRTRKKLIRNKTEKKKK